MEWIATLVLIAGSFIAARGIFGHEVPIFIASMVIALLIALASLRDRKLLGEQLAFKGGDISMGTLTAMFSVALLVGAGYLLLRVVPARSFVHQAFAFYGVFFLVQSRAALAGILVLAAVASELTVRGALVHALESRFGTAPSIWVSFAILLLVFAASMNGLVVVAGVVVALASTILKLSTRRMLPGLVATAMSFWLLTELLARQAIVDFIVLKEMQ
jgi:hypothetical protein